MNMGTILGGIALSGTGAPEGAPGNRGATLEGHSSVQGGDT